MRKVLHYDTNPIVRDVLFLDTENDGNTKEPISIQLLMNGAYENIDLQNGESRKVFTEWLKKANRVVAWNILYDTGLASSLEGNSYDWIEDKKGNGKWEFLIEGNKYRVKSLGKTFSKLESFGKAPPLFDLLKYWTIMIAGKPRSLKDVVWDEFNFRMIQWSEENAQTPEYQLQDVVWLERVYIRFFEKIADIDEVADYNAHDWQRICTTASFVKKEYERVYGRKTLEEWKKHNQQQDNLFGLRNPLEQAYNGGITCAPFHGWILNAAMFDIHAAYANIICNENTDRYKKYEWLETDPCQPLARDNHPILCKVETYSVMDKIQNSLKIYKTKVKTVRWMWSYDILAMRLLHPGTEIVITKAFKPIPLNPVEESLPKKWKDRRDKLQAKEGKTPRVLLLKNMCNTAYGVTTQRKPYWTRHTNMAIGGIITSRAHLILAEMIDESWKMGCYWGYSDTDSVCIKLNEADPVELNRRLNERIVPYGCDCELLGKFFILSLKRYIAEGTDLYGEPVKDKVRLHGKSTYDINEDMMKRLSKGEPILDNLIVRKTTANNPVGVKLCQNRDSRITHPHPFMFIKNTPARKVDKNGIPYTPTIQEWYDEWKLHIDTKLTVPKGAKFSVNFERDWHVFYNTSAAHLFYEAMAKEPEELDADDISSGAFVNWDDMYSSQYGKDLVDSLRKD